MKYIFIFSAYLFFSLNIFCQQLIQKSPLNENYIQYLNEKNAGTRQEVTSSGYYLGEIPSPVVLDFSAYMNTKAAISDPAYDLRTAGPGGTSLLTSVKNQGNCGSCWTFAAMGSIESRWKKLGYGTYNLSENNLKNCHEFIWGPCDGGNIYIAPSYFARKSGPISENDDPYVDAAGTCLSGLNEVAYIGNIRFVPKNTNAIKQALIDYGALYTNMYYHDNYFNVGDNTYFYNGSNSTNHAVLLVGWDDNKATAGGNGAWIIKNSWSAAYGEGGYFYISYNDTKVNSSVGYFYDKTDYDPKANLYSYSRLGMVGSLGYGTSTAYGLIKYTATSNQRLTMLGTWVSAAATNVEFKIYDDFNGTSLTNLLGTISEQNCSLPGYYTFNLSTPLNIANGNDFYVLVKYNNSGTTNVIPVEYAVSGYSSPAIESNKCWISPNGSSGWTLFGGSTGNDYDLCINAYTLGGPDNATDFTASSVGSFQIDLLWSLNSSSDNIMVAYNTENVFGTPSDGSSYSVNDVLSGGGTVIYKGNATAFEHQLLDYSTTYFYKIWSLDDNDIYSGGVSTEATTTCLPLNVFPFTENFTNVISCPPCWQVVDNEENEQIWQFGNYSSPYETLNFTANFAYISSDACGDGYSQNTDLISPTFDFSGYTDVTLNFKHFFREYTLYDKATLYYSLNNGSSWTQLQQWDSETSNPETYNQTISALNNQSQVKFKWNYLGSYGYYWIIDDINISATATGSLTVSDETHTVSANMAYQNVTVEGDGNLSIDADKILTVTGNFTIVSDADGTGSFIQNGILNVAGDITVQKYLPNTTTSGWTISVPVVNADADIFTDAMGLYFYNSSIPDWQLISSGPLQQMTGYVTRFPVTKTIEFEGALNNNTFVRNDLVRTTTPNNFGWNYVGNPYPSPIDWEADPGITITNLNDAIYFRRADGNISSFVDGEGVNGGTPYIPAMQAFWVQVTQGQTTGSIEITNDARVHVSNDNYKSSAPNILRLTLSGNNAEDETVIRFHGNATEAFDGKYDAVKWFADNNTLPQIYSVSDNENFAISSLPELTNASTIPLCLILPVSGNYTLSSSELNSFENNVNIFLEDVLLNTITKLQDYPSYSFNASEGEICNRFVLHFNKSLSDINNSDISTENISLYTYNNVIYIHNIEDNNSLIKIYNVVGQEVYTHKLKNEPLNKINSELPAGNYLVAIFNQNGNKTFKVFLK